MRRSLVAGALLLAFLSLTATAHAGHGIKSWIEDYYLDHPAPSFAPSVPPSPAFQSGGQGAKWELIGSIPTGNPHTDIDFFTQGNEMFASVGTLATGPNGGGQTIVRLVNDSGQVDPEFVKGHPSATCPSNPAAVLGLQHDVEATPKGNAILNERNAHAVRADTQLLIDATDSRGRCHDEQGLGAASQPRGGLELIDITPGTAGDGTDVSNPKEIGLTSHTGEAHTVNVDPKRPHIAYAVSSDDVAVTNGVRQNEVPGSSYRYDLDGFEVVDMSSCMNFPAGTTLLQKRTACRPQVFRYRYPTVQMALGHTQQDTVYGCHELEVYEDDRLACGSGAAAILFDMSGAFDDNGTPDDFTDDKPRGTPLPCTVRAAQTTDPFTTGAQVTDCVDGTGPATDDLNIPNWLAAGAPSLEGVRHLGTVHHMGRGGPFPSTVDNDFNHEAELTESGNFLLTTDERGGGVAPPGASCSSAADNTQGNGGVHAYRVDRLNTDGPGTPQQEWNDYGRTSDGRKAIYRAPVRTGVQATVCTAHVFQQIPGQNRIFMGWYSQGTQVVDFTEHPDGSIDFRETAFFIPANANEWVSHVFKVDSNADGSFTYYGATGDFNLGERGRNTIDVWKVTLPPPPNIAAERARRAAGGAGAGPPVGSSGKCMGRRARFTRHRLGRFALRARRSVIVRRAGTPGESRRRGRVYRYCVTRDARGAVTLAFDRRNRVRLVGSTGRFHRRGRIRRGTRVATLARSSRSTRLRSGLWASPTRRFVYGVRGGRVRFVAVVDRQLATRPRVLLRYLRLAGLRR